MLPLQYSWIRVHECKREDSRTTVTAGVSVKVALIMHRLIIRSRESRYMLARHAHRFDQFRLACDKLCRNPTFAMSNFTSLLMNRTLQAMNYYWLAIDNDCISLEIKYIRSLILNNIIIVLNYATMSLNSFFKYLNEKLTLYIRQKICHLN